MYMTPVPLYPNMPKRQREDNTCIDSYILEEAMPGFNDDDGAYVVDLNEDTGGMEGMGNDTHGYHLIKHGQVGIASSATLSILESYTSDREKDEKILAYCFHCDRVDVILNLQVQCNKCIYMRTRFSDALQKCIRHWAPLSSPLREDGLKIKISEYERVKLWKIVLPLLTPCEFVMNLKKYKLDVDHFPVDVSARIHLFSSMLDVAIDRHVEFEISSSILLLCNLYTVYTFLRPSDEPHIEDCSCLEYPYAFGISSDQLSTIRDNDDNNSVHQGDNILNTAIMRIARCVMTHINASIIIEAMNITKGRLHEDLYKCFPCHDNITCDEEIIEDMIIFISKCTIQVQSHNKTNTLMSSTLNELLGIIERNIVCHAEKMKELLFVIVANGGAKENCSKCISSFFVLFTNMDRRTSIMISAAFFQLVAEGISYDIAMAINTAVSYLCSSRSTEKITSKSILSEISNNVQAILQMECMFVSLKDVNLEIVHSHPKLEKVFSGHMKTFRRICQNSSTSLELLHNTSIISKKETSPMPYVVQ